MINPQQNNLFHSSAGFPCTETPLLGDRRLPFRTLRCLEEWRDALMPEDLDIWSLETDLGIVLAAPFQERFCFFYCILAVRAGDTLPGEEYPGSPF